MTDKEKGTHNTLHILPLGAERGSNPSNTELVLKEALEIGSSRMYFNYEQIKHPSSKIVGRTLPEIFNADNDAIETEPIDGTTAIHHPPPSQETPHRQRNILELKHDLNATIAPTIDPEAPHEVLKMATWNTQSFCREKMAAIHERLIKYYDIAFLQEVHNPTIRTQNIFNFKVNEDIHISPGTNHKAGVAIYINPMNPKIKVIPNSLRIDQEGRIISIQISWFNHIYNLVSIYAPVNDDKSRANIFRRPNERRIHPTKNKQHHRRRLQCLPQPIKGFTELH